MTNTTYKLVCKTCGKSYRTDSRRGARITETLKTNPDYLKEYQCRNCSRGKTPVVKTEKLERKTVVLNAKTKNVEVKVDWVDLKDHIPKENSGYIHRYFGKGKEKIKDTDFLYKCYQADGKIKNHEVLKNVLLVGETGTGKTQLVEYFCYVHKLPYYRIVMNGGTTAEDVVGQMIPDDKEKWKFAEQVLVRMMRKGGVFLIDEINAGQRDILHILNSLTDRERKLILTQKDGEVVRAVDNFLVIACMNPPDEYDMNTLPKSLKSRFVVQIFDYDIKVDKKVIGKGAFQSKLIEFTKKIRKARDNGIIETPLSTRDLVQFMTLKNTFGYSVAKDCMIANFQNGEQAEVKTQLEVCLEKSNILDKGEAE